MIESLILPQCQDILMFYNYAPAEVVFKLVVDEFQTREQVNGTMPITLSKSAGISLASPISLRITPLMLEAASIFSGDDFDEAGKFGI